MLEAAEEHDCEPDYAVPVCSCGEREGRRGGSSGSNGDKGRRLSPYSRLIHGIHTSSAAYV